MEHLYKLKEMLCKELEEYGSKGELTAGSLETIDKLAHAIKNLEKVIDADEGYSGYYPYAYNDGMNGSSRGSYRGGYRSYARGRSRDSLGRYSGNGYSRDGGFADELRELMQDAPNEQVKMKLQKLVEQVEM